MARREGDDPLYGAIVVIILLLLALFMVWGQRDNSLIREEMDRDYRRQIIQECRATSDPVACLTRHNYPNVPGRRPTVPRSTKRPSPLREPSNIFQNN